MEDLYYEILGKLLVITLFWLCVVSSIFVLRTYKITRDYVYSRSVKRMSVESKVRLLREVAGPNVTQMQKILIQRIGYALLDLEIDPDDEIAYDRLHSMLEQLARSFALTLEYHDVRICREIQDLARILEKSITDKWVMNEVVTPS